MAIGAYFPASTSETTIGNVEVQTLTTTDLLAPGDWLLVFQSGEGAGNPASGQAVPLPVQVGSTVVLDVGGTHPTDASAGAGNAHTIENVQSGSFSDTGWIDLGYTAGGYTAGNVGSPGRNHAGVWGKLLTTADDGTDGAGTVGDFTVRVTVDGSSPNGRQLTTAILVVTGSTGDVAADITTTTNIALSSMTNNRSTSGTAQTQIEWFKPTDTSSTDGYHADAVGDDFIQIWYGSIPPDNAPNPTQAVSTGTRPTDQGNTGLGSTTAWPVPNQASPGDYGGTVTAFNQHAAFVYFDTTNSSSPGLDAWTTFAEFDALWTGSPARFAWEVGGANSSSGTDNAIWSYNTHSIIIKAATAVQVALTASLAGDAELTTATLTVAGATPTLTASLAGDAELTTATLTVVGAQVALTSSLAADAELTTATLTVTGATEALTASLTGDAELTTSTLTVAGAQVALTATLTGDAELTTATLTVSGATELLTSSLTGDAELTTATLTITGATEALTASLAADAELTTATLTATGAAELLTATLTGDAELTTATLTITGATEALTATLTGDAELTTATLAITGATEALTASLAADAELTTATLTVTGAQVALTATLTGDAEITTATISGERTIEEVYDLAVKIDRLVQVIMALGLGGRRR